MEKYIPDIYQKSIYTIDYSQLWLRGIKCILFDLDNTLIPANKSKPTKKNIELFKQLEEIGFKIIIFSNSTSKRVKPFSSRLGVEYHASSMKPFTKNFVKVLSKYNFEVDEVAIVGDQILTDILGGNTVGITTILVNKISNRDIIFTKLNRFFEKVIVNRLSKKDLFSRGKYYE